MIPIYQPYISSKEKEYLLDVIDSGWISSKGKYIDLFKDHIRNTLHTDYVVLTHNGSVSLMLILAALGLGRGDEVCVPSLTYAATISQPAWLGLGIRLFDSDIDVQPSFESFCSVVTPDTKALILPQLYGNSPDMDKFVSYCRDHDIYLIEDSAENFGSRWSDKFLGTLGVAGSFSFFGNKTITTGEGGCVVTSDKDLYERMSLLNNQSHIGNFVHSGPGFNFRMTNMQAAVGCAQIEKLEEILEKKKQVASFYKDHLQDLYVFERPQINSAYWMPLFRLNRKTDFKSFYIRMQERGVDTRPCFSPCHLSEGFSVCYREQLPICESIYSDFFNLPCYPDLTQDNLTHIVNSVRTVLGERND